MAGFDNPMRDVGSEETIRQIAQVHYEDHDHDDASDDDDDDDNDDHDHDDESDDDDDDEDERKVSRLSKFLLFAIIIWHSQSKLSQRFQV